jgi:hypothetical protein
MNEPLQISLQPESGMPLKRLRKLAQTDSSSSAFADEEERLQVLNAPDCTATGFPCNDQWATPSILLVQATCHSLYDLLSTLIQ